MRARSRLTECVLLMSPRQRTELDGAGSRLAQTELPELLQCIARICEHVQRIERDIGVQEVSVRTAKGISAGMSIAGTALVFTPLAIGVGLLADGAGIGVRLRRAPASMSSARTSDACTGHDDQQLLSSAPASLLTLTRITWTSSRSRHYAPAAAFWRVLPPWRTMSCGGKKRAARGSRCRKYRRHHFYREQWGGAYCCCWCSRVGRPLDGHCSAGHRGVVWRPSSQCSRQSKPACWRRCKPSSRARRPHTGAGVLIQHWLSLPRSDVTGEQSRCPARAQTQERVTARKMATGRREERVWRGSRDR